MTEIGESLSVDRMALQVRGYGIKSRYKGTEKKEKIIHSKKTSPGLVGS